MHGNVIISRNFKAHPGLEKQAFEFIRKLQDNPRNPSLHIEPMKNMADPRMRTGRVNDKYRAVLAELDGTKERQFLLIAIMNHDDAIDYARKATVNLDRTNGAVTVDTTENVGGAKMSKAEFDALVDARAKKRAADLLAQQMYEEQQRAAEASAAVETTKVAIPTPPPRDILRERGITRDDLLTELGLSPTVVADVEGATDENDLDAALSTCLEWERDAVLGLVAGMSIDEVIEDLDLHVSRAEPDREVSADSDAIIETVRKSDQWIDPSEEDLKKILEHGTFAEWRTYLHPSQRAAAFGEHQGSARVLGGAGTGKTVVLLHRAKYLADKGKAKADPKSGPSADPKSGPNTGESREPRIFLTTFTRDLANQLKAQMSLLDPMYTEASQPGAPGMWIAGIDATINRFIRYAHRVELQQALKDALGITTFFQPNVLQGKPAQDLWEEAASLNGEGLPEDKCHPKFLEDEFNDVILTNSITEKKDYLRVSRAGRGTPLGRSERKIVWEIVQSFIRKCTLKSSLTFPAMAVVAAHILEARKQPFFDHILIDEAQDFHAGHWRFIRAAVAPGPNDIFLAEDSHQRIYGNRLTLSHYGIVTRGRATRRLRLNYRTTAQNLAYASAILENSEWVDSSGDVDSLTGYRSVRTGPLPQVVHAATSQDEYEEITRIVKGWLGADLPSVHIGVLTRSRRGVNALADHLQSHDIEVTTQRAGLSSLNANVSVMTMHNAKGMEFTHVILASVSEKAMPRVGGYAAQPEAEQKDALQRERALLYVAASRARDELVVTMSSKASPLLPEVEGA